MLSKLFEQPKHHMVSLDFYRALAIILVFLNHSAIIFQNNGGEVLGLFRFPMIHSGWSGVQLFFVLSGYLIGYQLWSELKQSETINFKTFFIKRTFRIWPLYYFICFIFIFSRGLLSDYSYFSDLYFLSNYLDEGVIKGSWSLSVEEQFYLISPLFLFICVKYLRLNLDRVRYVLYFIFLLAPVIRFFTLKYGLGTLSPPVSDVINHLYTPIHTNYDSLIVGLILSNFKVQNLNTKLKDFLPKLLCLLVLVVAGRLFYKNLFNYSLLAILFGSAVWIGVLKENIFAKFLDFKVVSLIAKLSFGIYLWHFQLGKWMYPKIIELLGSSSLVVQYLVGVLSLSLIVIIASSITYLLIEKPALNYRKKFL